MYSLVVIMVICLTLVCGSDLDDLAQLLSKPLEQQWAVQDDHTASMDCLQPFLPFPTSEYYYGVYHNHDSTTDGWNIFIAQSMTPKSAFGPWKRLQLLVNGTGSMPFIHQHTSTQTFILAYEHMESTGNYPILLFYDDFQAVLTGKAKSSTTLLKRIHTASDPNTYTNDYDSNIVNVGTPTITSSYYEDNTWFIYLRFHYTTKSASEYDTPGFGSITYKPSKEVKGTYYNWQAYFDNDANNAIEIARNVQGGKIGQRANIRYKQQLYYLYEAQLTHNFDWHDWRLFLYSSTENRAVQVDLNLNGVVDFANPSINQDGDKTIVTLFVPSEAMNTDTPVEDKPGCLVYTLPSLL